MDDITPLIEGLNAAQRDAVTAEDRHLLVLAGLSLLVLPLAVQTALPVVSPHALTSLGTTTPAATSHSA